MKTKRTRWPWWRVRLLPDLKGRRILDATEWQGRWRGKPYTTPVEIKRILKQLTGVNSMYIEWVLLPEYLKGRPGHPASRLLERAQQEIVSLFDELDTQLKKMREMYDKRWLPGRPVESFRQWLLSFEKDVEPACPRIGVYPKIMKKFKERNPELFRGRPQDDRVLFAFLISEELRQVRPARYWPIVADLIQVRFPGDKTWCTPAHLSRAVGRLRKRGGDKNAQAIVQAHRQWFKRFSRKAVSRQSTPPA